MPEISAVGTNTAVNTMAMATTAPLTSSIALVVASTGECPSSNQRSTFSTTTMASSTTMPMASTNPNRDRLFSENPNTFITANVPMSATGIEHNGMIVARHVCRNTSTTITTSTMASNSVSSTALMDWEMNVVGL